MLQNANDFTDVEAAAAERKESKLGLRAAVQDPRVRGLNTPLYRALNLDFAVHLFEACDNLRMSLLAVENLVFVGSIKCRPYGTFVVVQELQCFCNTLERKLVLNER